jgi:hypothetical protein
VVFKTRIKRSGFIINIMMVTLFAVAAGVLLLCAYGSTCVQFDIGAPPMPPFNGSWYNASFSYYPTFMAAYATTYFASWLIAFVWGVVIYFWLTQKRFAHLLAIVTSALGFIVQAIPGIISDTDGFSAPFDFGSPHWGGAIANLLVLIVLIVGIIPFDANPIRNSIKSSTSGDNKWGGSRQLTMVSVFLFWLALVSFLGSSFMADAHVVNGYNIWQTVAYQFVGGAILAAAGGTTLTAAFIVSKVKPLKTI